MWMLYHLLSIQCLLFVGIVSGTTCKGKDKFSNKQIYCQDVFKNDCCWLSSGYPICCEESFNEAFSIASNGVSQDSGKGDENIPWLHDSVAEERSIVRGLAKLVGIIIGAVVFVFIVCTVCCCCCPFCLLAKRKQRGAVLRQNDGAGQPVPTQDPYLTTQPGYQPSAQPQNPVYPNQQAAPYPPAPSQPYPPTAGYPPQAGYPSMPEQPPPYPGPPQPQTTEYQKQPAFNPNAP